MTTRRRVRADPDPAVVAAVDFLLERRWYLKAMREHVPGSFGLCAKHSKIWPCRTWELANAARQLDYGIHIPEPRESA